MSRSLSFCLQVSGKGRKLLFFLSPASPAKLTPTTRLDNTAQRGMGHCFKYLVFRLPVKKMMGGMSGDMTVIMNRKRRMVLAMLTRKTILAPVVSLTCE